MTREEAISRIKDHIDIHKYREGTHAIKIFEALDMAIKALENFSEIVHCKDCVHRPMFSEDYDPDAGDSGLNIVFPDFRCPCSCEDPWYNRMPEDDWFCGNGERK